MDGETPANPENPTASRGQILVLDGEPGGHDRGHPARRPTTARRCPSTPDDLSRAEITTRDIDRGDYPHFLLKEITEAPASFRKTLRGKLVDGPDGPAVVLGARRAARRRSGPACATASIRRVR